MGFREDMAAARAQYKKDMAKVRADWESTKADMAARREQLSDALDDLRESDEPLSRLIPKRGVVAELAGVTLYRDHIEYNGESRALAGVSARVVKERVLKPTPFAPGIHTWYLMITGPDFEWAVKYGTAPINPPSRLRLFARRINKTAPAS